MPSPKGALATLRPDLGLAMQEFDLVANASKMVGLQVAPVLEAQEKAGNWGSVKMEELLATVADDRASGQRYNQSDFAAPDVSTFNCTDHGIEGAVDDDDSAQFGEYFDTELLVAQRNRNIILTNLEKAVAALVAATSYTSTVTDWTNKSTGTPIADTTTAKNTFILQAGIAPNALIINELDYNLMRNSAEMIDRVKYSGIQDVNLRNITAAAVAQALDIEQIIICGAIYNTANPGAATAAGTPTLATIWPQGYASLVRIAKSADPKEPGFARTIHWGEDGSTIGAGIESYRDESRRSNMVRCRMNRHVLVRYSKAIIRLKLGA